MTQPKAKPRTKLTNADYVAMTPPANTGPRYQLIDGELSQMAGATLAHQVFSGGMYFQLVQQSEALQIGLVLYAPYDVHVDPFNTYQPDLLFVSNERQHIFDVDGRGITGAPDVVVEILSESTRRHDLNEKLPVYLGAGVREVWVVDLDAATVAIHAGDPAAPDTVFTAEDALVSGAMPGVSVELGPIFARAVGV